MTGGEAGWRAVVAVALTFLMVTSVIAPVGAISTPASVAGNEPVETASTPTNDTTEGTDGGDTGDVAPVVKQYNAVQMTGNLSDGDRRGIRSHIDRAHDRFNTSLRYYRGPIRVNESEAYTHDAVGVRALAQLTRTDEEDDARKIADIVYRTDNQSATATVTDAREVLDRYGDEMDNQGLRISAEKHLENAERTLARGQSVGEADGRQYFQQRAQALTQLRTADQQARLTLRFVDRAIAPNATITSENDPVWDGTGNRNYTVRGNVSTVRPQSIENVTVTVNDNRSVEAATDLELSEPGANASFAADVNLTQRVNRIEVTVTDGANDGGNEPGQQGTAVLRLDGDGLPESYEHQTTGTDPLDPNSNSTRTAADESNNETIDGREDFDGDRLSTLEEYEAGTDPHDVDTDDDGLTDWQELRVVGMDPLVADSDSVRTDANESANGVTDGAEDLDGDGLTNAEEFANGSSPLSIDGDADGLNDTQEIELGTDPLNPDTDDDFLRDGLEIQDPYNTDPLDPDTDDDGIVDGNETYTTAVANESAGATVEVRGPGNAAYGTVVRNETAPTIRNNVTNPARASEFVTYGGVENPSNASIIVEYEEETLSTNESDVAVFQVNRTNGIFEPLNTTIDAKNDTASTDAPSSMGTVVVMSPSVLDEQFPDPSEIEEATINRTQFSDSDIDDCAGECSIDDGSISVGPMDASDSTNQVSTQSMGVSILSTGSFNDVVETISVPDDATAATIDLGINASPDGSGGGADVLIDGSAVYSIGSTDNPDSASRSKTVSVSGGDTVTVSKAGNGVDLDVSVTGTSFTYPDDGGGNNPGDGDGTKTDRCAATDAIEDDPCPDSSAAPVSIDFPAGASEAESVEIALEGNVELRGNSSAAVTLSGAASDTKTWSSNQSIQQSWSLDDVDLTSGDDIEIGLETQGRAVLDLDRIYVWQDTDGDGFSDRLETTGFHTGLFGHVYTDPADADTDGDGLDDDQEIVGQASGFGSVVGQWRVASDPTDSDTDGDGLDDKRESSSIEIVAPERPDRSGHYNMSGSSHRVVQRDVDTSPLFAHSDTDGLNDAVEVEELSTDPTERVTYEITEDHQQYVDRLLDASENRRQEYFATRIGIDDPAGEPLTDATDDFDYVFDDSPQDPRDRFSFTAIDGANRYDLWLSNYEELQLETDPWDPDSDDDGLTDGWEVRDEIPSTNPFAYRTFDGANGGLNATDPDTDGDGYWDGWIGVHNVSHSDNVVLYRENLKNNITGNDIVQKQIHVHEVDNGTPGADLYNDGTRYHSNTHVGELHWETDPIDESDTPDPQVRVEIDYQADNTGPLQNASWRESVEKNYAIYGINVTFLPDRQTQVVDFDSLPYLYRGVGISNARLPTIPRVEDPFTEEELYAIRNAYSDSSAGTNGDDSLYFFVGNATQDPDHDLLNLSDGGGVRWNGNDPPLLDRDDSEWIALFQWGLSSKAPGQSLSPDEHAQAVAQKAAVHELGHVLNMGENEPAERQHGDEVYSGNNNDPTKEEIEDKSGNPLIRWSVMSEGAHPNQYVSPTNEAYFAFSLEELSTVSTRDTQVKDE